MRRTRTQLLATLVATIVLTTACSGSSKPSTGKRAPREIPAFPPGSRPADAVHASAMLVAFVQSQPDIRWYAGGGTSASGPPTITLAAFVYGSTAAAARRSCDPLGRLAAFFMQGHPYSIEVTGRVHLATGSIVNAAFKPFTCAGHTGSVADPVADSIPVTLPAATKRLAKFLNGYLGTFGGGGSEAWLFTADATGTGTTVGVTDADATKGLRRCATLRPLATWFLGRFAEQAKLRVAGNGNASWPARERP